MLQCSAVHYTEHNDGPAHHESHELMTEELLNLVRLLDGDGDPDRVDTGLDQYLGTRQCRHC